MFNFGHIRLWDQCAVYILYSKVSTDPGLLKIRHSHRFVAVVIQFLIPLGATTYKKVMTNRVNRILSLWYIYLYFSFVFNRFQHSMISLNLYNLFKTDATSFPKRISVLLRVGGKGPGNEFVIELAKLTLVSAAFSGAFQWNNLPYELCTTKSLDPFNHEATAFLTSQHKGIK